MYDGHIHRKEKKKEMEHVHMQMYICDCTRIYFQRNNTKRDGKKNGRRMCLYLRVCNVHGTNKTSA